MPRPLRPRGSRKYEKPPLSVASLADRLAERGLVIDDQDRTQRYIKHIGYYRLSPYTIPFQKSATNHRFREGTSFDEILDLYIFDRRLRLLVMDAIERVEVAVRAALTDHMSTQYNDPQWYINYSHFKDKEGHEKLVAIVKNLCESQLKRKPEGTQGDLVHKSALEHYLTTYKFPEFPPSWLIFEYLTVGQLSSLYRNLKRRYDRTTVAKSIGLSENILGSWMQSYVRVRNICAHHGRLWNVGLGVYPMIPSSPRIAWPKGEKAIPEGSKKRLYPVLTSLQSVFTSISPNSSWAWRLEQLLHERPEMNLRGMGFPQDWKNNPFWSEQIAKHPTRK